MKKLITLLFLSPTLLLAQSLISTGNEIIYVEPGTAISSVNGFHMSGTSSNVLSIEQGNTPYNLAPASRRVLVTNSAARLEVRNLGRTQIANFYMDVDYAATRVIADLRIQNTNSASSYNVGLEQISHANFNDIPVEWTITRNASAPSNVHNLVFFWGNELETAQIPVKRLFIFDNAINEWVQLPDANTSVDEFNKTLVFSGFRGELNSTRFMIAQAEANVLLTGNLLPFDLCSAGSNSVQSFSVQGTNLSNALSVHAPLDFSVSLIPQGPFLDSVTINPIGFNVQPTVIYIKLNQGATLNGSATILASSSDIFYGNVQDSIVINGNTDTINPSIIAPLDITTYLVNTCRLFNLELGVPTTADNCTVASVINDAPTSFTVGTTSVIWTVTDGSGNTATATQNVLVVDTVKPTLAIPLNLTVSANNGCDATGVQLGNATAVDNCAIASITNNGLSAYPKGVTNVTWTAVDVNGNITTAIQTVTVIDNSKPLMTVPSNLVIAANANCEAVGVNLGTLIASDNCGTVTITNDAPLAFPMGMTTVTWTAIDSVGNSTTGTQTVQVNDSTAPTIAAPSAVTLYTNNGCFVMNPSLGVPTTADNCTVASVINDAPTSFTVGTTSVTWTVTDGSGNTATATQNVLVVDTVKPTLAIPLNLTVSANNGCDATGVQLGNATAVDNCAISSITNNGLSAYPKGVTNVTWTAVDVNGNSTTAIQTVTVIDNTKPLMTVPSNLVIVANANCEAVGVNLGTPIASDNCGTVTITNDAPLAFPMGMTTVTWTAIDSVGNSTTGTQTVQVNDSTAPTIAAPSAVTLYTNNGCFVMNPSLGVPTTADNCTVASVINDAPTSFTVGTTSVIWTVTDGSGNTATATQNVLVVDTVKPTLAIPLNLTVSANNGCDATGVQLGNATAVDNCAIASITNNGLSAYPKGVTNVTWTAVDVNGNITTAIQTVTVIDNSKPLMTVPSNLVIAANANCEAVGVNLGTLIASDNCGTVTITNDAPLAFPMGMTTVTWTAIDSVGNSTTGTQTVQVNDSTAPTIAAPSAVTLYTNNGCFVMNPSLGVPTTADNCTVASVINDAPTSFTVGTTSVIWTVTDGSGNTATATQNVLVVDTVKPTLAIPLNLTVSANNGCDATGVQLGNATAVDNCAIASITNNGLSAYPKGVTNVTWTAVDVNGNITTAIQTVTVIDNSKPLMTVPSNLVIAANANCEAVGVNLGTLIASDNCGTVTITNDAPLAFPMGMTTVTWTAIDSVGNSTTGTQTVQVNDSTAPTIAAPSAVTLYTNNGCFVMNPSLGVPTTADNCTVASVINDAPTSFTVGTTSVTWTVTDGSGNTATAMQNVLVVDTVKPTIIAPSNIALSVDSNCQVSGLALGRVISSDNCAVASVTNNSPSVFGVGQTIITWTVTDVNGNIATADQLVTISDITPPVITAPSDISVATNVGCSANGVVLGTPIATDNCAVTSITNNAPVTFPEGITTVVWTAVDANGNRATAQQVVTVIDSTAPVLTPPADLVYNTNNGCFAVNVPLGTPIATDNCFLAALTNNAPSSYPIGNTTITWTATDVEGNSTTATQLVTIVDAQKPTLIVPSDIEVNSNLGCSATNIALGNPLVTDNCGIKNISNNAPTVYPLGQTTVVWTVEDSSGNITTDNQYVLVKDTIIPNAQFRDITIKLNADGSDYEITVADVDNGTSDNCGIQSIELSQYFFNCIDLGQNRVTATVIDNYGNEVDKSFIVTVTPSNEDVDFDGIDDACDDDVNTTVVKVPNGFTPDGDNFNDYFVIPGLGQYTQVELEIFNQYGNRVYQSKNYQNDWDGTSSVTGSPVDDDTYFYVLTLDGKVTKQGYVYINRIR